MLIKIRALLLVVGLMTCAFTTQTCPENQNDDQELVNCPCIGHGPGCC